jgi:polyisoprenoid-binding protein YceI
MRLLAAAAAVAALAGCAVREPSIPQAAPAAPAPELPAKGAVAYRVVTAESELRVRIHRAGPLADVGHEHVATTSDIGGRIYLHDRLADSGFEFTVPLRSLTLDAPAARDEEGFEGRISERDRRGTKDNMLATLQADAYPDITLRSIAVAGPPWYPRITVRVTLHGTSRDVVVPTAIVRDAGRLVAIGGLRLKQTDFGITPYSTLGGGLHVGDELDVAFRVVAEP